MFISNPLLLHQPSKPTAVQWIFTATNTWAQQSSTFISTLLPFCGGPRSCSGPIAAAGSGWWRVLTAGTTCACCCASDNSLTFTQSFCLCVVLCVCRPGGLSPWRCTPLYLVQPDKVPINYYWAEEACTHTPIHTRLINLHISTTLNITCNVIHFQIFTFDIWVFG